jgi:hypothetical protein
MDPITLFGLLGGGANNSTSTVTPGAGLPGQGAALNLQNDSLANFQRLIGAGPNIGNVQQSQGFNQNLINMLGQYSQSGGLPNQQQMGQANQFAQAAFAPQRQQLQQDYTQAGYQNQQQAARLGRQVNDPVLQAKLQNQYANNSAQLSAQQGAYGSNLALQLPQQQLGYATQQAGLADQLSQQAQTNQYTLLGLGNQLYNQSLNYGLSTATRTGSQQQGGSVGGAIGGALGGFGMGGQAGFNLFGQGGLFGQSAGQQQPRSNVNFGGSGLPFNNQFSNAFNTGQMGGFGNSSQFGGFA